MPPSGDKYEYLLNSSYGDLGDGAQIVIGNNNVYNYRTRTIKSGDRLELEIFPIWRTQSEHRAARQNASREAQKKLNERNAIRTLTRKVDTNFTDKDYHATLTYDARGELPDEKQARRDTQNYFRRIKHFRKGQALPPLKYVNVMEFYNKDMRRTRVHHHVIMSGGVDRQVLKSLWGHGRVFIEELQPENGTLEGLVRYITKQPGKHTHSKRWTASRNLKPPKITTANKKVSKKHTERLAADVINEAPAIFTKLHKDYSFDKCTVKGSEFVSGVYIYATMYKTKTRKRE